MKLIVSFFVSIVMLTSCTKTTADTQNLSNASTSNLKGRVSGNAVHAFVKGYSKFKGCAEGYGDCMLALTAKASSTQKEGIWPVTISLENELQLKVANTSSLKSEDDDINIPAEGLMVPADICRQLDASFIQILPGTYTVKYNENPLGTVVFDIVLRK